MGAGYGAFSYFTDRTPLSETSPASIAEPPAAASNASFAKHLEVSGLRVSEGAARQLKVNYVVTNHSGADMPELQFLNYLAQKSAKKSTNSQLLGDLCETFQYKRHKKPSEPIKTLLLTCSNWFACNF